jgi:nitrite reductase (NADH) small subunit
MLPAMGRPWLAAVLARRPRTLDLGPLDGVSVGKGRVFDAAKRHVAVFRTRTGEVYATDPRCPRGESLSGGMVAGRMVLCPEHGYAFNLKTGACVGGASPSLRTYAVRVSQEGRILVDVEG